MNWNALLSRARPGLPHPHPDNEARTDFQRDFDRIVFSSAFRRLQDKTQVFPLSRSDYVRTRLTHSLEVSSVGRSLGAMVGDGVIKRHGLKAVYPQDFGAAVAAACLAHDIGNPPFGHAGEDAIRLWFHSPAGQQALQPLSAAQRQDFLNFEGNAQGFRIITRLQSPDNPGGMQLTCATLGAFTKYPRAAWLPADPPPGIAFKKFGFYQDDADLFAETAQHLGLTPVASGAWTRHPLAYLVEAADDICYRIIDVEDAFRLQQLPFERVRDLLLPLTGEAERAERKMARITRPREKIEYLRAKAIGAIIDQAHQCFMEHEDTILAGEFQEELLDSIPAAADMRALKECGETQIYIARPVVEVEAAGFEVLGGLLERFVATVNDLAVHGAQASPKSRMLIHLIPEPFAGPGRQPLADPYRRLLAVTDFVSGMTDSYAVTLFKKLTGISLPTG